MTAPDPIGEGAAAAADLAARVDELEIKLGFAEDQIDELNRAAYRQQVEIDRLLVELRALRQQLMAQLPGESRSLRDELPPHY
jgi:SlyX protein